MPQVWAKKPNVRVQIVGQNPSRQVLALAKRFPGRVLVTGWVGDLRPYLAHATVSVAPILYGAGIQNKVLEAMAMTTPVVATSLAVDAIQARSDEQFLLGDTPTEFARQILRLLEDPSLGKRLTREGRRYVEQNHNMNQVAQKLEHVYRTTV